MLPKKGNNKPKAAKKRANLPKPKPGKVSFARALARAQNLDNPVKELACSQQDPWSCTECVPDGAPGATCFSVKEKIILTTGTTGTTCSMAMNPDPTNLMATNTGASITAPSYPAANSWTSATSLATISSVYSSYRIVSGGMKMTYTGNTQTDQGTIVAGLVPSYVPLSSFNGLSITAACQLFNYYRSYPVRNGSVVTWRSSDFEDMAQWKSIDSATSTFNLATKAPYLLVLAYSCSQNQTIFDCECIFNFEGRLKNQTFLAGGIQSGRTSRSVPGWYEKLKAVINQFEPVIPVIGGAITGFASGGPSGALLGAFGALSNGLAAPGVLGGSGKGPRFRP